MGTRTCSPEVRRGRLAKAGFLHAAEDVSLLDDSGQLRDAVVTLYVHAGIAAADVICCSRLGLHATGDNHAEAVALLKRAGAASHRHLATLLGLKTKAGYSHTPASAADVKKAARAAASSSTRHAPRLRWAPDQRSKRWRSTGAGGSAQIPREPPRHRQTTGSRDHH
jgi:hypothetical protein